MSAGPPQQSTSEQKFPVSLPGGPKSEVKVPERPVPSEAVSSTCRRRCLPCVLPRCACEAVFPSLLLIGPQSDGIKARPQTSF